MTCALLMAALSVFLAEEPKAWERTAADELKEYLSKIVGDGEVEIQGLGSASFYVGDTAFAKTNGMSSSAFGNEEWAIESFGRNVVLNGGGSRGCLYAVYHFLEDCCGVRWWSDDDEDVPSCHELSFPKLSRRGRPRFFYRMIFRSSGGDPRFAARCRVNGNGAAKIPLEYGGGEEYGPPDLGHTWGLTLPFEKFGKEHPEWYALRDGKRTGDAQLCVTCPGLAEAFAENFEKFIAQGEREAEQKGIPAPRLYDISMNDNSGHCQCDRCVAAVAKYGMSGAQLLFENEVAGLLGRKHPDLLFAVLAYNASEEVPKNGVRAADNVIVKLCNTKQNMAAGIFDEDNRFMHDQVRLWGGCAKNLSIWDYAIAFNVDMSRTDGVPRYPLPSEFGIAEKYRFYADNGAKSVLIEHERQDLADMYELKYYLERHVLEDPSADPARLMKDFMVRYYGPAAKSVYQARKHLWHIFRDRHANIPWFPNLSHFGFIQADDVEKMQGLFDEAERLVGGDAKRMQRVRKARSGLDLLAPFVREAARLHAPEAGVSERAFLDFPVRKDGTWYLYNFHGKNKGVGFVDDPDAETGLAVEIPDDEANGFPLEVGFYDMHLKKIAGAMNFYSPKDEEGYAWYEFEMKLPENAFYMYLTRKWALRMAATSTSMCGKTYQVRVRMKAKDGKIRISRVVLVERKGANQ